VNDHPPSPAWPSAPENVGRPFVEIEAKFYVPDLAAFREHALAAGATLLTPRRLERNWRFDRPDGSLQAAGQVLRLRQDATVRLACKGPADSQGTRREVEFGVDDAQAARAFLEDLGFQCLLFYEKYREVLRIHEACLMLDELPFGNFVEVESESLQAVRRSANQLGLRWEAGLLRSYAELIGDLESNPMWDAATAAFRQSAASDADAGAALHLERAWVRHA
jgi:adenylate cyclase, class 2